MRKIILTSTLVISLLVISVLAFGAANMNFVAHLAGNNEVPPVDTKAQGQVIFSLSNDGNSLNYRLIVANIYDVQMSHIHLAPAGTNGPIVVWLYPSAPPAIPIPGRTDGVLAEGTITAANLVGPLAGMTIADLVSQMKAGKTYVNVHTTAHPGGEIRGQIR